MTDRRSFVAWLGSLPLTGRHRPLRAAPPIVIDATPTALYQQPDGRNNLVRVAVTGLDAPAARARVTDRRGTLVGAAGLLSTGAGLAGELWVPLSRAVGAEFQIDVELGKQRVGRRRVRLAPPRRWTLYWIASSHTDVGLTALQEECLEVHRRNLDAALARLPAHPDFRWTAECALQLISYVENRAPAAGEALARAIREGKVGVSAVFAQPLTGILDHETFARVLWPAGLFARERGLGYQAVQLADVPGHALTLPTLLAASGVRYLASGVNPERAAPLLSPADAARAQLGGGRVDHIPAAVLVGGAGRQPRAALAGRPVRRWPALRVRRGSGRDGPTPLRLAAHPSRLPVPRLSLRRRAAVRRHGRQRPPGRAGGRERRGVFPSVRLSPSRGGATGGLLPRGGAALGREAARTARRHRVLSRGRRRVHGGGARALPRGPAGCPRRGAARAMGRKDRAARRRRDRPDRATGRGAAADVARSAVVRRAHLGVVGQRIGPRRGGDRRAVAVQAAVPGRRRRRSRRPGRGRAAPDRPQHRRERGRRPRRVQRLELGAERRGASAPRRGAAARLRRPGVAGGGSPRRLGAGRGARRPGAGLPGAHGK